MAPKVQASEMMNSHITSFFDGIANGEASITPAPCPMLRLASLTVPPGIVLQLHPQNEQKVDPQHAHEMPVVRRGIEGAPAQRVCSAVKFQHHSSQSAEPTEYVKHMDTSENIEEGAVRVGGKVKSLRPQIQPRQVLPNDENQA